MCARAVRAQTSPAANLRMAPMQAHFWTQIHLSRSNLRLRLFTLHTPECRPKRLLRGRHTAEWAESRQLELKCFRCGECEKWVVSTCDWTKFPAFMFTHTAVIEGLQLKIRLLCSASSATPQTAVWIYAMCAQRIAIQLRMRWWRIFSRFCLRFAVCVCGRTSHVRSDSPSMRVLFFLSSPIVKTARSAMMSNARYTVCTTSERHEVARAKCANWRAESVLLC